MCQWIEVSTNSCPWELPCLQAANQPRIAGLEDSSWWKKRGKTIWELAGQAVYMGNSFSISPALGEDGGGGRGLLTSPAKRFLFTVCSEPAVDGEPQCRCSCLAWYCWA